MLPGREVGVKSWRMIDQMVVCRLGCRGVTLRAPAMPDQPSIPVPTVHGEGAAAQRSADGRSVVHRVCGPRGAPALTRARVAHRSLRRTRGVRVLILGEKLLGVTCPRVGWAEYAKAAGRKEFALFDRFRVPPQGRQDLGERLARVQDKGIVRLEDPLVSGQSLHVPVRVDEGCGEIELSGERQRMVLSAGLGLPRGVSQAAVGSDLATLRPVRPGTRCPRRSARPADPRHWPHRPLVRDRHTTTERRPPPVQRQGLGATPARWKRRRGIGFVGRADA